MIFRKKEEPELEYEETAPVRVEVVALPELSVLYLFRFLVNWTFASILWFVVFGIPLTILFCLVGLVCGFLR